MKKQGFRDTMHMVTVPLGQVTQPNSAGAGTVLPPVSYHDLGALLSPPLGRTLMNASTYRVVGMRIRVQDAVDAGNTAAVYVTGAVTWVIPTRSRVKAHELAMRRFMEVREGNQFGMRNFGQFWVKYDGVQATQTYHSVDAAAQPYALLGATAGHDNIFSSFNAAVIPPAAAGGGGFAQRLHTVYASEIEEGWNWNIIHGEAWSFGGFIGDLGAWVPNVGGLPYAARKHAVGSYDEIQVTPGHHFPVMCGVLRCSVNGVGPRPPVQSGGNMASSADNEQQVAKTLTLIMDIMVEGWHPLARVTKAKNV